MKLRLRNNSIRLRLSQTDVKRLLETGIAEESVVFGGGPGNTFTYKIVSDEAAAAVSASIAVNQISLTVPGNVAVEWAGTEQVSIEGEQATEGSESLRILIEKDFACLERRSGGDDDDAYPNPLGCGPGSVMPDESS